MDVVVTKRRVAQALDSYLGLTYSIAGEGSVSSSECRQGVAASKPSKPQPRSFGDFAARVRSYRPATWFAKPTDVSPVQCARFGWINCDVDMVECTACKRRLSLHLPPTLEPSRVAALTRSFVTQLNEHHAPLCPWKDNPSPLSFSCNPFHAAPVSELQAAFNKRMDALLEYADLLPAISSKFETMLMRVLPEGQSLPSTFGEPNSKQRRAAYLALCGWTAPTSLLKPSITGTNVGGRLCLQCNLCGRQAAAWNFSAEDTSHQLGDQCSANLSASGESAESGFLHGSSDETNHLDNSTENAGEIHLKTRTLLPESNASAERMEEEAAVAKMEGMEENQQEQEQGQGQGQGQEQEQEQAGYEVIEDKDTENERGMVKESEEATMQGEAGEQKQEKENEIVDRESGDREETKSAIDEQEGQGQTLQEVAYNQHEMNLEEPETTERQHDGTTNGEIGRANKEKEKEREREPQKRTWQDMANQPELPPPQTSSPASKRPRSMNGQTIQSSDSNGQETALPIFDPLKEHRYYCPWAASLIPSSETERRQGAAEEATVACLSVLKAVATAEAGYRSSPLSREPEAALSFVRRLLS